MGSQFTVLQQEIVYVMRKRKESKNKNKKTAHRGEELALFGLVKWEVVSVIID